MTLVGFVRGETMNVYAVASRVSEAVSVDLSATTGSHPASA